MVQAKVATAGDASEEQSEKLAALAKERDAIQLSLDTATAEMERLTASLADEQAPLSPQPLRARLSLHLPTANTSYPHHTPLEPSALCTAKRTL